MDKIKFSENHYKKIMYDYLSLVERNKKVLKIYTPPNSNLSFLKNNSFNGIINSDTYKDNSVTIKISDWNNNSSYIKFRLKSVTTKPEEYIISRDRSFKKSRLYFKQKFINN